MGRECVESTRTNATLVVLCYRSGKECHATGQVHEEDVSSLGQLHDTGAEETAQSKGTLSTSQQLGAFGAAGARPGVDSVIDEIAGNSDCSS